MKLLPIITPGEILFEEFMQPLGITAYRLAKDIGVPLTRIANIVRGKRAITPTTALLLSQYFRMSERFFLNLQSHYDLEMAKEELEKVGHKPVKPFRKHALTDRPEVG